MNPKLKDHLEATVRSYVGYIQQTQDAADIMNCGVDELVIFLATEDRARLRDAAEICKEPPAIQRAACGLMKAFSHHISLRDVVHEIHEVLKLAGTERRLLHPDSLPYNSLRDVKTVALSVHDLGLARSIKKNGVPEILIVLSDLSGNVTLAQAAKTCNESPEVQRAACELWLMQNRRSQKVGLESCVKDAKNIQAQD